MNRFLLLLLGSVFLYLPSYGQEPCTLRTHPYRYDKAVNRWIASVYQLPSNFTGSLSPQDRDFYSEPGAVFRGFLPYDRPGFLPYNDYNFDINFNDTGWETTDSNFFPTIYDAKNPNDTTSSCDVQLQYFGVTLKTQIRINHPGIYKITIGSDDGSFLKDQYDVIHNNWGPGRTYNYETVNYYKEYTMNPTGDTWAHFDLSYYETTLNNRLSFNFELYFGPGEIAGSQDVCGIAPDPAAFVSRGPATYAQGDDEGIRYQWQYSLDDDPEGDWTDIPGATGLTYKVPKYDKDDPNRSWTGIRYFRRVAIPTAVVSEQTASNIVSVNINPIENLDQSASGDNKWIGHVYRGIGAFTDENYTGRIEEAGEDFLQRFGNISLDDYRFVLTNGCYVTTTNFSVRYKMTLTVDSPRTYTFRLSADDGFRFFINGTEVLDRWAVPPNSPNVEHEFQYVAAQAGSLDLVIEYYERTGGNKMQFDSEFVILPLEWGKVTAEACGADNCLTWETIQEKNTSHFELERSYDGLEWEMFDNSVQAQGNSTELNTYYFTDKRVMASKIYYRIRQVDLDGAFAYSDVMRVDNPHYIKSYLPFPNPTIDKVRFFSATEVLGVSLVSSDYLLNGHIDFEKLHDNRYEVDLVSLRPGNYVIVVETTDGRRDVFKVIKK